MSWSAATGPLPMNRETIFLFDIDGVLVEPLGYRRAVHAALAYFARQMGLPDSCLPPEDIPALFEAHRVTSEWDMVPVCLAALLDHLAGQLPGLLQELPPTLSAALPVLRRHLQGSPPVDFSIDYAGLIPLLGARLAPGRAPAEFALDPPPLFPHLAGHPLLEDLLGHTRDIHRSLTTRIFQQFTLGSQAFTRTYGLPAELETSSFLQQYDRPCLSPSLVTGLLNARDQGILALAAYTLRPSLPPQSSESSANSYAPEAEMALERTGLSSLPLIGFGRIRWLAGRHGVDPERYLKPSPVQALAAVLAARSGREKDSLLAAVKLAAGDPLPGLHSSAGLEVHVFEDSCGGIEAVQAAAEILNSCGLPTQVHAWGIAVHPGKAAALKAAGVPVFPGTQHAVRRALSSVRGD